MAVSFIGGGNRGTRRKLPYDHDGAVNLVYQTQRPISVYTSSLVLEIQSVGNFSLKGYGCK